MKKGNLMKSVTTTDPRFEEKDAFDDSGHRTINSWELFMNEEIALEQMREERDHGRFN